MLSRLYSFVLVDCVCLLLCVFVSCFLCCVLCVLGCCCGVVVVEFCEVLNVRLCVGCCGEVMCVLW